MADFLKKWKKFFTFAAFLSIFVNVLQLTFSFYMFTIYRNILISFSLVSLANITTAAVFAIIMLGFFIYVRSRLLAYAGKELNIELRKIIYVGTVKGSVINTKGANQSGLSDLETLQNFFSSPSIYALFDAPWAPFFLALIFLVNPVMGCIATLGAVAIIALSVLQEVLIRKSMRDATRINVLNQRFVDSFLRNTEVINGMGMIGAISDRFVRGNNLVMMNQTISSNYAGTIQAMLKPLQNVIQVMIYFTGAYLAMTANFNVGLMVAASIIMGRGLAPLRQIMTSWQSTARARDAYLRLDASLAFYEQQAQAMPLPEPQGALVADNVFYGVSGRMLVNNVSFTLQPGEFLGIIGPSGAGKTTLCRLLLGIIPSLVGKVYLDGKDIFSWSKDEVGQYIGYLPQEIELFPGTVAENIARLGNLENEHIEQAIEICGIGDMVEHFSQGLETQLEGEKGLKPSGGQKQRIGLARAVYKNPRLLVLDEPTSNLDEQGEEQLLRTLLKMKQSTACTCIMVTHKPSLLQSMDKILVLRNGSVAGFGPKDAVFAELAGQKAAVSAQSVEQKAMDKVSS
jgi:PrtD family type I secretion system ABC transporter